ncbi:hypothetical protein RHECNPAF_430097 [Rhizobium etli CNPAF512]|nr:hypothetical protein RHECNPAF_430097 [Rhizobium etli CNPAF512]
MKVKCSEPFAASMATEAASPSSFGHRHNRFRAPASIIETLQP